jgi:hypothetical protein
MGIPVPGDNPTPAEIIPVIERRLAAHMNHVGRTCSPCSGDFVEWKLTHDAYHEFLTDLRAAQAQTISPTTPAKNPQKNSARSESAIAPQQPPAESKVSSGELLVSSAESQLTSTELNSPPAESNSPNSKPFPSLSGNTVPSLPNLNAYLDTASQQACGADLNEYLSGRSPLDNLTAQQQEAILLLLNDHSAQRVAEVIAQPPPLGFNLKTTDASILRFRNRLRHAKTKAAREQDQKAVAELLAEAQQSDDAFQSVVQRLIKERLVRAATSPMTGLSNLDSMITSLTKLRKQALAERKQLHAEKIKPPAPEK